MILPSINSLLLPLSLLTSSLVSSQELHASGRWIVNQNNQRVKLRCVNWAGHGEANIPEGLQSQTVDTITKWISTAGFNCVRLTFSIDMTLSPNKKVSDSFKEAATSTGTGKTLTDVYDTAVKKNPFLSTSTTLGVYEAVIQSLARNNIMIILDNHNSKAGWCCSTSDGNGWWKSALGYEATNSQNFDVQQWLAGLTSMAQFSSRFPNIIGLSMRNELRAIGNQVAQQIPEWYKYVGQGAAAIHAANPKLLIPIGGIGYATDLSFLGSKPFDRSALGDKVIYEFHSYSWSSSVTGDCPALVNLLGKNAGYLLTQNKAYTGPLWLSEFGWGQEYRLSFDLEQKYIRCLVQYMENNDADWAYWALQGSYYIREGVVNYDETFGLLNRDWSGWRNASFVATIGGMMRTTQGPVKRSAKLLY